MKKTYPLQAEGQHPDRVLDAVKHHIRKYFKRERARDVPEGADFWDFDCKVGATADTAQAVRVSAVVAQVDALAQAGAAAVYVEIITKHGLRTEPPVREAAADAQEASASADTETDTDAKASDADPTDSDSAPA